jgi:hypothetical protein
VPINEFFCKYNAVSDAIFPRADGIVPWIELLSSTTFTRRGKRPKVAGIVPFKLELDSFSSVMTNDGPFAAGLHITPVNEHHVVFDAFGQLQGCGRLANAGKALVMLHTV